MAARKVAAGWYEVDTPAGVYTVQHVPASSAYAAAWMVTTPGDRHPSDAYGTKRDAVAAIALDT